ncbi:hypothetical protein ACFFGV_13025 [Pontibacillus salicampi]|uniref:DUF4083 domain-containing protein n=1 Tax=Pontibacillus salicampi TaxID=1449801 RepID=A0ABV6LQ24_9BACI
MDVVGSILVLLPLILIAFVIRWVRIIKQNTDKQVQQNEIIIDYLRKNKLHDES